MLIEILIIGLPVLAGMIYAGVGITGASLAEQYEMPSPNVIYATQPKQSPIVQLVVELLKKGEGWVQEGKYLFHEQADIRLLRMLASEGKQWRVFVQKDGSYERVELNEKEEIHIGKHVNQFNAKAAEHRKLAVAKIVAQRLSQSSVLVQSGLGGGGSARASTMGNPPALTYDPGSAGQPLETMSRNSSYEVGVYR